MLPRYTIAPAMVILGLCLATWGIARSAVIEPVGKNVTVALRRGSTNITSAVLAEACAKVSCSLPSLSVTVENCESLKSMLFTADGLTRITGSNVYQCVVADQSIVRFKPNLSPPVCPEKPADEQQRLACPAPTIGTWLQDKVWTLQPPPTCWVLGEWAPTEPPAGMCAPPVINRAPTISGSAPTTGTVGQLYSFTPTASDADGDPLTFEVIARPPWAGWAFDTATGRMSGTPSTARTHTGIRIVVSDGREGTAELRLPTITIAASAPTPVNCVVSAYGAWTGGAWSACSNGSQTRTETRTRTITTQPANGGTACPALTETRPATQPCTPPVAGTASLRWAPPNQHTDGSSLSNLAGFRVVYGRTPGELTQTIQISNPSTTTYTVTNLASGTWYFAVKAYTSVGTESGLSNIWLKVVL